MNNTLENIKKIKSNSIYLYFCWGTLNKTTKSYSKVKKIYTGSWWQRFLHLGPFIFKGLGNPKITNETTSKYLNCSLLVYDSDIKLNDIIYYGNYSSIDKSIIHMSKDINEEEMSIDFTKINKNIKFIIVAVNSFTHESIEEIPFTELTIYPLKETYCPEVIDNVKFTKNNDEIDYDKECLILGVFFKKGNNWFFKDIKLTTYDNNLSSLGSSVIVKNLLSTINTSTKNIIKRKLKQFFKI